MKIIWNIFFLLLSRHCCNGLPKPNTEVRTVFFPDEIEAIFNYIKCKQTNTCPESNRSEIECSEVNRDINLTKREERRFCDPRNELYLWPPTNVCYKLLTQGPCERHQWLVFDYNEQLVCRNNDCPTCAGRTGEAFSCPDTFILITNEYGDRECECPSGNVYHPETNRCYQSYSQGPCPDEYIISAKEDDIQGYGICQPNKCEQPNQAPIALQCMIRNHNAVISRCFPINSQGPCNTGTVIDIRNTQTQARCLEINTYALITGCHRGSRRDFAGRCNRRERGLVSSSSKTKRPPFASKSIRRPGNYMTGKCPINFIFLAGNCYELPKRTPK